MTAVRSYLKLLGLVTLLIGGVVLIRLGVMEQVFAPSVLVERLGAVGSSMWAPPAFVALYAIAVAFALPGSILTLAGGAVFGLWWGFLLNSVGANLGANAAFGLSRWLGRDGVERLLGSRAAGVDRVTERHGFLGLLLLRLIPLVPFNALNVGSGLTGIRWKHYALATVLGIIPGTFVYTLFAEALVAGSTTAGTDATRRLWIAGILLAVLSMLPLLARKLGWRPPGASKQAS